MSEKEHEHDQRTDESSEEREETMTDLEVQEEEAGGISGGVQKIRESAD